MKAISAFLRLLLSSRYTVSVKGHEILKGKCAKLILPNHQALVDPQICFSQILKHTTVVPVVSDIYYHKPLLKSIFKLLKAVPVPDITLDNRDSAQTLHSISKNIVEALSNGQSVLLYPSGQIAGQGYEKIFNKQSAFAITGDLPKDVQIIGVRIGGLWGSMWSRAWIGKSPNFAFTAMKALFYLMANLIFFVPRRKVTLEFYDITDDVKKKAALGIQDFNNYLEEFYNSNGEEPVNFLKHFFYAPKLNRQLPERIEESVADHQAKSTITEDEVDNDIYQKIVEILVSDGNQNPEQIHLNANLRFDLNIDSIGMVTIISEIEKKFGHTADAEITAIKTVAHLCFIAMRREIKHEILKPSTLTTNTCKAERVSVNPTNTITTAFINTFSQNSNEPFAYDKTLGTLTKKEFLLKAYVVSKIIKQEAEGKHVGIMLPALQSTTLLVAATYLAGKIPVMLNWTVGTAVMEHCIKTVDIKQIFTAKAFYDKVADQLPQSAKEKSIFFEQKAKNASLAVKLKGLASFYFKSAPAVKSTDTAVILFTSGSESLPKAVELTHKNLMHNLHGSMVHLDITTDFIFLSFLPPFHSFGFTVLTVLPLVSGIKVAYTPDPTDSREVVKILQHTKASGILGTPTFLKLLLSAATTDDLVDIKLAVTGAESLHSSTLELFKQKTEGRAILLEGYGITECSPVLSINPLNHQKTNSVGTFIKGVDHLITNISTYEPLPQGKEGMIMVAGESIFNGYTDREIESPFVKINNTQYYKTGDLGYIDEDGFLFITGRLKRFIKIAGEMISLPALEKVLLEKYGEDETTVLAVEGTDKGPTPQIVLFTTKPLQLSDVNDTLKTAGIASIAKIHSIKNVTEIPLLGTGKTDYKVLKALI